jgi:hypothetical protein
MIFSQKAKTYKNSCSKNKRQVVFLCTIHSPNDESPKATNPRKTYYCQLGATRSCINLAEPEL